jgi:hypothetical protein
VIATRVKENDESVLQNKLRSLGIDCKRTNEFNDKDELEALANAIKEVYFQDYKTAYAPKEDDRNNYDQKDLKYSFYRIILSFLDS